MINLRKIDYSLRDRRIDLWLIRASPDPALRPALERLLGPEEVARARAFRFDHLRHNYVIVHGLLRILLARYLGDRPARLQFSAAANGKPSVYPSDRVRFNISHSDNIALFGFTETSEIGVDVETLRPMDDLVEIAERFFCHEESAELMSLPANERQLAFFHCWTRKEAYLKAVGDGLRISLDSFRVSLRPSAPARMLQVNGSREAAERWTLHGLEFPPSCVAALAYLGPPCEVRVMSWVSPADFLEYVVT